MKAARVLLLLAATLCADFALLSAQEVDEFVLASGPPRFGEVIRIRGNHVIWQRCGTGGARSKIQYKDLSRLDCPEVDVADYLCSLGNIVLGPTHLFWSDWFRNEMWARPIDNLEEGMLGERIFMGEHKGISTASADYLFARVSERVGTRYSGTILALPLEHLSDPSPEDAFQEVATFETYPASSPYEAVSEKYFVWTDMNPDLGEKTWRIYAKRIDDLFVPGEEMLVLDTKFYELNTDVALEGSLLVFQGSLDPAANPQGQIYIVNLDAPLDPQPVVVTSDPNVVVLEKPGISSLYVVWTETRAVGTILGLGRRAFGRRLENGLPVGEIFPLSQGPGGAWLAFDGNIALWNGRTHYFEGVFSYYAIVAAELPLPGAQDVGDVDANGRVNITDGVVILNYLFFGGWRPRRRLADVDLSGRTDITDAVRIFQHLFGGQPLSP